MQLAQCSSGPRPGASITLADIGFPLANAATRRNTRLNRRSDGNVGEAAGLAEFLTFKVERFDEHFERLGLGAHKGKSLKKAFEDLVAERGPDRTVSLCHDKEGLLRLAFDLLVEERWGVKWFGPDCERVIAQPPIWPEDSTVLIIHFTSLLRKVFHFHKLKIAKTAKGEQNSRTPELAHESPVQEQDPNVVEIPNPAWTRQPIQQHRSFQIYSSSAAQIQQPLPDLSEIPNPTLTRPSTAQSSTSSDATHIQEQEPDRSLRARTPSPIRQVQAFVSPMLSDAIKRKRDWDVFNENPVQIIEVPDNADIRYTINIKNKVTHMNLADPSVYHHTDTAVSIGIFTVIKTGLEVAGFSPIFQVADAQGPAGLCIHNEVQWKESVRSLYFPSRTNHLIVDVFI